MADAERVANTAVDKDEQIGGSEAPNGIQGEAAQVDEVEPNLEISKPETKVEAEDGEEAKPADKPTTKLPWDHQRQKKDQELANLRKRVDQAEHVIEELRKPKPTGAADLDAATAELEQLIEDSPDEFADDSEVKAYRAKLTKVTGKVKAAKVALTAKAEEKKPKPDSDQPAIMPENTAPTMDDFNAMCVDSEIEFGSQFSDVGRASCIREMTKLGFGDSRWPTKEQLGKIVTRVFRETRDKAEGKPAKKAEAGVNARPANHEAETLTNSKVRSWNEIKADVAAKQAREKKR